MKSSEYHQALDAALLLRLRRHAVDAHDALHVPAEVVAVELDLEVRQAVEANPLGSVSGRPSPRRCATSELVERVEGADQVVQRHPRLRLARDVLSQRLAGELGAEVMAEVVRQEVGAVGVVAVEAVDLAEGVVQGGVEGAGGDQRAQRRDRLGQAQLRASPRPRPCDTPAPASRSGRWGGRPPCSRR